MWVAVAKVDATNDTAMYAMVSVPRLYAGKHLTCLSLVSEQYESVNKDENGMGVTA